MGFEKIFDERRDGVLAEIGRNVADTETAIRRGIVLRGGCGGRGWGMTLAPFLVFLEEEVGVLVVNVFLGIKPDRTGERVVGSEVEDFAGEWEGFLHAPQTSECVREGGDGFGESRVDGESVLKDRERFVVVEFILVSMAEIVAGLDVLGIDAKPLPCKRRWLRRFFAGNGERCRDCNGRRRSRV